MSEVDKIINSLNYKIKAMGKRPFRNFLKIRKSKAKLQAIQEGARDVTTTQITNRGTTTSEVVNKNNYQTYENQVTGAYEMYNCTKDYGSELCKGVVDYRTVAIGGEGLSVNSENKKKLKWIEEFLEYNRLHGSKLIDAITTGELEGKCLMLLKKGKNRVDKEKDVIKVLLYSWYLNRYKIQLNPKDLEFIDKITYRTKDDNAEEKTIAVDKSVYVKLGGMDYQINLTSNRLHAVLTDIENYSRGKYDLRTNTHLFGKISPYWKTETAQEAKSINKDLQETNAWQPGTGYAGPADYRMVEPSGDAADQSQKDMITAMRNISFSTGLPIFLAYPELMSNRATADTLYEVLIGATKKERLIWEEAFKELIQKAMVYAVDEGIADNSILKGEFQVKLPIVSISMLKQIIEVWYPLVQDNIVSDFTFRNMLPGINPSEEVKIIDKEKAKKIEDSPFANNTTNDFLADKQEEGEHNHDNENTEKNK
jgi:hypothetical protein